MNSRLRNRWLVALGLLLIPGQMKVFGAPASQGKAQAAVLAKDATCWHLSQRSMETGRHDLYISPRAFKDVCFISNFTIISRAPDWKVNIYNGKTKTMFTTTVKAFRGSYGSRKDYDFREDAVLGDWSKGVPKPLSVGSQQLDTLFYFMNKTSAIREEAKNKYEFKYARGIRRARYWELDVNDLPPEECALLWKIFVMPHMNKIPIRLEWRNLKDHSETCLQTYSIEQIKPDKQTFSPPAMTYARVKTEDEVYKDAASSAVTDGLSNWLGAGDLDEKKSEKPGH